MILFLVLFLGRQAQASVIDLAGPDKNLNITAEMELSSSSADDVDFSKLSFQKNAKNKITQGYSASDLWMKVSFFNSSQEVIHKILYFDAPLIGALTLFEDFGGLVTQEISGPGVPLELRAVPVRWGALDVLLDPGQEKTYYIKRSSHHALNTQAFISSPEIFAADEAKAKTVFYFYLGGIMCLVAYNLMLGISTRQKDYFLYSLFAGSFSVTALTLHNVVDTYLIPNNFVVFNHFLMFFSSLTAIAATYFIESFLNITKKFAVGYWGCRALRWFVLVPLVGSFFVPFVRELYFLGYWIDVGVAAALLFFVFCGFYVRMKYRYVLSNFFLISWFAVMAGVFVWICALHGFIRTTPWTQYSLLVANLGEMLILALGLAYKIKTLDEEKKLALQAAADKDRYHRLVKVLSHDVANTVSGVIFHSESLHLISENPRSKEHTDRINRLAKRLSDILNAVRAEEVYNSIKSQALLEKVDLREACVEAIDRFSWELQEKNIQVGLEVPEGLCVTANRSALVNQVLVNLLSNCIKFSEPGKPIGFRVEERPSDTILVVWDKGRGIPQEKLPGLFDQAPLFSSSGTNSERGTGFGTKLIGEYMKLFGGQINVASECVDRNPDQAFSGTAVHLIFPRHF